VSETREALLAVVRAIPAGRLATYGDVARRAGFPRSAREVGRALSVLPDGSSVPWWRVVNREGRLVSPGGGARQAEHLHPEGVDAEQLPDGSWRVDLDCYRWDEEAEEME
jgi:methylated-DNA-protein-cysteine methyltransferase-like protein